MNIVKCACGQFYNKDNYSECPNCGRYPAPFLPEGLLEGTYEIQSETVERNNTIRYIYIESKTRKKFIIKKINSEIIWNNIIRTEKLRQSIDCDNIIKFYKAFSQNGSNYIVYEYIEGYDLEKFSRNFVVADEDVYYIAEGLAKAIQYLESKGITHGDIKPHNIIYNKMLKKVVLIDLDYLIFSGEKQMRKEHKYYGTLAYSAPEHILSNKMNIKSDIYSMGLVLYYLIEKRLPFPLTEKGVAEKASNKIDIKFAETKNLKFSAQIEALISDTLKYDVQERISIEKFLHDLYLIKPEEPRPQNITNNIILPPGINDSDIHSRILEISEALFDEESKSESAQIQFTQSISLAKVTKEGKGTKRVQSKSYHDLLLREYDNLVSESRIIFRLWVSSLIIAYLILVLAIVFICLDRDIEALYTIVLEALVYVVQRLFAIKDKHHRVLIDRKIKHLERGDLYEYGFKKIEKLESEKDRRAKINELIDSIRNNADRN